MNNKYTQAQAIEDCKRSWEIIRVKYHRRKPDNPTSLKNLGIIEFHHHCPLCEWVKQGGKYKPDNFNDFGNPKALDTELWCEDRKRLCPLYKQYHKSCLQLGFDEQEASDERWFNAIENLKLTHK